MLHISFLACTKVELWDLIVCTAVNGGNFQSCAMTLTLVRMPNIELVRDIFIYYDELNFMFIDRLLFELLCKNMEMQKHRNMEKHPQMLTSIV